MAPMGFLSGFLLGLLVLALTEGAAVLWAVHTLRRRRAKPPRPQPRDAAELSGDRQCPSEKQGFLWMVETEKTPKVSNKHFPTGGEKGTRDKRNILEIFPVRTLARIKGQSLVLSGPDVPQITIELLNCSVVAVSASNLPSRKWDKRYPIKLESKGSEICKGNKVFYLYGDTSLEKESWCRALRLASTTDKEKLNLHARLCEEFQSYTSSLNAGYLSFLKPSALCAEDHEVTDKAVKPDGASKVRGFLKKFSKKASAKPPHESRTNSISSLAERMIFGKRHGYHGTLQIDAPEHISSSSSSSQEIKQPSTTSSDFSYQNGFSDSFDADIEDKIAIESTLCWNLLFSRLFFDAKMSDEITKSIKTRIQHALSNMRTPAYIGEVTLTDLNLGKLPPYVRRVRVLPLGLNEQWAFEVDFEYCGGIFLDVETRLEVREPELQKDVMDTTLTEDSNGDVNSEMLESVEHYGSQFPQALASEDKNEAGPDVLGKSKSTGRISTYMSKWKNILHSIADHVSQVPFSLSIKITSVRGTMRIHINPPPSDQIWYGFTSMPEIEWELESSIGDRRITNSHIASLMSNKIKASLHQSLVLPNCESIPMSWMISEKDDWVPRKVAPFMWLNREAETANYNADIAALIQPDDVASSESGKSSPPAPSTISDELPTHGPDQEPPGELLVSYSSSPDSETEPSISGVTDQLRMPLLSTRHDASEDGTDLQVTVVPQSLSPTGDDAKLKGGRRARLIDFGKRRAGMFVKKIKENAEMTNNLERSS